GPIGVAAPAKIGPGGILTVDVTNTEGSGVPDSVTAAVINVTATEPTAPSHLTIYPSAAAVPNVANLNFVAGQTVPNLVTVKVGLDGYGKVRDFAGETHVVFDIQGWYGAPGGGSLYTPIPPQRILDTRPAPFGPIGGPVG